jgi:hypothetical protein
MIGLPYPKLMNSNNDVDMAAAVIMCSAQSAQDLGVPRDRWVFPHSGADCHEHTFVSIRDRFDRTPAIEIGGSEALRLAGVDIDDVSVIDLYSCFPSAVQLGAASLGIDLTDPSRQWSRTGGLSFAGGPWNNYVMHAIATVVGDLRERPGERGLVWGNGGLATKHSFGVYSTEPPDAPFRHADPQDRIDALPQALARRPVGGRRSRDDRGLHRDVRSRGRARTVDRLVSARRRPPGVGHLGLPRGDRRHVRGRMGGPARGTRRRRRHPHALTPSANVVAPVAMSEPTAYRHLRSSQPSSHLSR